MPLFSKHHVSLAAFLATTHRIIAIPQIAYPINSQLPPVAYVSQPFDFVFSPSTFTSDLSEISYSISDQPDWLSLDTAARRLSGTPTLTDVTIPIFQIIAADSGGRATASVTLVVQQERTLFPSTGIYAQLAQAGSVSLPATLLLHPSAPFAFTITRDLFNGASAETEFYVTSSDGSPLPSWLQFDQTSLHLSGVSPLLLEPNPASLTYEFALVASNVLGFSESRIGFSIAVSSHLLAFANSQLNFTVSKGGLLNTGPLLKQVYIDGTNIARDQIVSVRTNAPAWVSCDGDDLSCSGTPPEDLDGTAFLLSLTGIDTNAANATITVQVVEQQDIGQSSLENLGNLTAVAGTYLSYIIKKSEFPVQNTTVDANLGSFSGWLSFTATNLTLHGLVPTAAVGQTQNITFTSASAEHPIEAFLFLDIVQSSLQSATTASGSGPDPTSGSATSPKTNASSNLARHPASLILAIVLPISGAIFITCVLVAWLRKRRKNRTKQLQTSRPPTNSQQPMHRLESEMSDTGRQPAATEPDTTMHQDPRSAPRLELPWAPDSLGYARKRLSKRSRLLQRSVVGPSWDDLVNFEQGSSETLSHMSSALLAEQGTQRTASSLKSPGLHGSLKKSLRRSSRPTQKTPLSSHPSKAASMAIRRAVGLPKRVSGAGHGTGGNIMSLGPDPRSSWQTTLGTIPFIDSRPSTIMLDSFPAPPSRTSLNSGLINTRTSLQHDSRPTPRMVDIRHSDSFEVARQRYHAQRTRDRLEGTTMYSQSLYETPSKSHTVLGPREGSTRTDLFKLTSVEEDVNLPHIESSDSRESKGATAIVRSETWPSVPEQFTLGGHGVSRASSRQFDSAISSDSQWEDENLVADENTTGEVYWQSKPERSKKWSPRLPFESRGMAQSGLPGAATASRSHRPRLADQRRRASVEGAEQDSPSRSHKGSLRFV